MKNWVGQEIMPGDLVYRGARKGDSSEFKIGKVKSIDYSMRTAKVNWLWKPAVIHNKADRSHEWGVVKIDSTGTSTIDSMVLMSDNIEDGLNYSVEVCQSFIDGKINSEQLDRFLGRV